MGATINYKVKFTYRFHRGEIPHEKVCEIISKVFPTIKTTYIGIDTQSNPERFVTAEIPLIVPIDGWHESFTTIFSVSFDSWDSEVVK